MLVMCFFYVNSNEFWHELSKINNLSKLNYTKLKLIYMHKPFMYLPTQNCLLEITFICFANYISLGNVDTVRFFL